MHPIDRDQVFVELAVGSSDSGTALLFDALAEDFVGLNIVINQPLDHLILGYFLPSEGFPQISYCAFLLTVLHFVLFDKAMHLVEFVYSVIHLAEEELELVHERVLNVF